MKCIASHSHTISRAFSLCVCVAIGLLVSLCTFTKNVSADAWPAAKPIRWIVAYPAGGGSDFLARTLAPQLSKQLEQSIIIENRPGAAGIIGTDLAAKAAPDGYTIATGDNGVMVFHQAMYKKLGMTPFTLYRPRV